MLPFQVGSMKDGKPLIVLDRGLIGAVMETLERVRFSDDSMEHARTWALVKLYCIGRQL